MFTCPQERCICSQSPCTTSMIIKFDWAIFHLAHNKFVWRFSTRTCFEKTPSSTICIYSAPIWKQICQPWCKKCPIPWRGINTQPPLFSHASTVPHQVKMDPPSTYVRRSTYDICIYSVNGVDDRPTYADYWSLCPIFESSFWSPIMNRTDSCRC